MHKILFKAFSAITILAMVLMALPMQSAGATGGGTGTISLTTLGTAYTQNFDTLASSGTTNSLTIPGWYLDEAGSSTTNNGQYAAGTGSSGTGDTYSFGNGPDRAFGGLLSGTLTPTIGTAYVNNTGANITALVVSYNGEQWRIGNNAAARDDRLDFQYSTDATSLITGTWSDVNSLDFMNLVKTAAAPAALDGNNPANRTAVSSTISGLSIPNGATFWIRWTDFNATGADDGLSVDDFSITPNSSPLPTLSVGDVTQNEGNSGTTTFSFNVSLSAPAGAGGVTFDIATADNTATTADNDYVSKSLTSQSIAAGQSAYTFDVTVNGDTSSESDETFFVNVTNAAGATVADGQGQGTITNDDVAACSPTYTPIYQIQGSGAASPLSGSTGITTQGVVVGDFQGAAGHNGFYLQDSTGDGNVLSSDGIFVFVPSASPFFGVDVNVGDVVQLTGRVTEFSTMTEIDNVTALTSCGTVTPLAPTSVTLPETTNGDLERYEGMLISIPQTLTVEQNFFQGRYGQITLGVDRLYQATNTYDAGSPQATAEADLNARSLIVLDDGWGGQNPNPIPYIGQDNTLRAGDTVTGLVGTLDYGPINSDTSIRDYRLQPTAAPAFTRVNGRAAAPAAVGGNVKVASFNVLNYFNGDGQGSGFPTSRGADTLIEFNRQRDKIIAAITAINPDVAGLMEMENDAPGSLSAVQDLVNGLNAASAPGTYAAVVEPAPGSDEIKVAMIYKPGQVTPVGAAVNYQTSDPTYGAELFDRPPLAQTFQHTATGAKFTVIVNHFKSKGSCPTSGPDLDQGDGQGCWNPKRVRQAEELLTFIAARQAAAGDNDVLVIGDLNAYGMEDPIQVLTTGGLVNEINSFLGADAYSYVFDGMSGYLDHALATASLDAQVTGVTEWHINADEPSVIDYNTEFKPQDFYQANPYRSSDHDPVIVGLNLTAAPTPNGTIVIVKDAVPDDAQDFSFNLSNGSTVNQNFSLDNDGDATLPNSQTFSLAAGTYTASELSIPAAWTLTGLTCTDPSSNTTTSLGTATATIDLASSETVTCTFQNTQQTVTPAEPFFSEYVEGSSNNKALEIYNGTGAAIDLGAGGYNVFMSFNGGTSTLTVNLTGTVANGDVFVLAHGAADPVILAVADQTSLTTAAWFNGDDAIVLRKGTTILDVIGQIGFDPGTEWGTGLTSTADNTLRRKTTIQTGDTNGADTFDPAVQWDGFATNTFNGLGCYSGVCSPNVSIDNVSLAEGDSGTTAFNFTVSLSAPAPAGGVTFDIATQDDTAVSPGDFTAQALTGQTIPAGSSSYSFTVQVNGDTANEPDETFFVNVTNVTGGTLTDGQGLGTILNDEVDVCTLAYTPIYQIQGSGTAAAITGNVTTQGVVVGDFEGTAAASGFYMQALTGDSDAATSDGIFVYTGSSNLVSVGDVVRVTGYARERFTQTTINGSNSDNSAVPAANVVNCGTGSVPATDVSLPFASATFPERYEGMYVRFPQSLVIAEYFNYDRFGEIVLALPLDGETRPFSGTAIDEPGAAANARTAANALSRITLDDAQSAQNPPTLRHPNGSAFSLANRFRGGDTVQNAVGVLGFDFSLYRIIPTGPADYTSVNSRPASPESVGGSLRVAAMNTLNFFVTLDTTTSDTGPGPCGALQNLDCRGADADQPLEFTRQRDKLLTALSGLNADIIGLNELESTPGAEPLDSIVSGMPGYDYIHTGPIGTDAIKVGMIYRPAVVTPIGPYKLLTSAVDPRFIDTKSRPSLAQTFEVNATGARFTVVVNHLKSKGSACTDVGDPDLGDGQGNCSQTRRAAAEALVDWLATDPTGSGDPDFIIMGDLNSYAMEDTIDEIKAGSDDTAGTADDFTNLIAQFQGTYAYSYTFDGQAGYLDHALANASLLSQVTGATEWHINSDEPDVLDYDTSFKPAEQEALYEVNQYRTSDHDAVVVGLNLVESVAPNTTIDSSPSNPSNSSSASFTFSGTDNLTAPANLTFECKLDGGSFSACTSPQNYTGLSDGSHTFQVRAIDESNNVDSTPASFTWVVDTTAPDTTIDSNPSNPSNSSSASFSFSGTDTGTGVASFECKLDGGGFSACTSPQSYTGLSDGSHTFQVRAIDGAGNVDPTPASFTWTIDATAPTVTINQAAGQADPTGTSPINFTVVFSEAVTDFTGADVTLGGTAGVTTATVTGSGTTYNVAVSGMTQDGTVTASIPANAATDATGNGNTASTSTDNTVTYNFNVAPTANVTGGQCSATNAVSGTVNLTLADADGDPLTLTLASNSNTSLVPNANIVLGGSGNNRTVTVTGAVKKSGTATLTFHVSDGSVTIPFVITIKVGTDKKETVNGTAGVDIIFGMNGDDIVNAGAGNDLVCGGNGAGTVNGGAGDDILEGGNGNDILRGEDGNDILRGGAGNDRLEGGNNDDTLTGSSGADFFSGGAGTDTNTDFTTSQGDTSDGT